MTNPPIVTNRDREWAVARKPAWCQHGNLADDEFGELVDDGGWLDTEPRHRQPSDRPNWNAFVQEQIEQFESHYAAERRTDAEWSSIWRKGWWPKVDPKKRFPKSAPKEFHPFFRKGSPEFARAFKLGTPEEKRIWDLTKVAQFKPDDPRLKKIQTALTDTTRRMTGET